MSRAQAGPKLGDLKLVGTCRYSMERGSGTMDVEYDNDGNDEDGG
jgi:hypothetical protein